MEIPRLVIALARSRAGYFRMDAQQFAREGRVDRARECRAIAEAFERFADDLEARQLR